MQAFLSEKRRPATGASAGLSRGLWRDRPLEDCTVYELLAHGANNEWDSLEMTSLRKDEKKGWLRAFYKDGERKVFLKRRGMVNRYYLLALLTHGAHKRPVPHGQNNDVYRALMGMTTATTRRKEKMQTIQDNRQQRQ